MLTTAIIIVSTGVKLFTMQGDLKANEKRRQAEGADGIMTRQDTFSLHDKLTTTTTTKTTTTTIIVGVGLSALAAGAKLIQPNWHHLSRRGRRRHVALGRLGSAGGLARFDASIARPPLRLSQLTQQA